MSAESSTATTGDHRDPTPRKKREAEFDPVRVRDISEAVYRIRLEQDCEGNVAKMIEKDGDNGEKLRERAGSYDTLTRAYLKATGAS